MIGKDAYATVRMLPGEPDRLDIRCVEIDDPTLGVLIRIALDTAAVPPRAESVTLLPRQALSSRRARVWPEVPLELYVDLAVATVNDEEEAGLHDEVPAPAEAIASSSAPRRHGAVNAARHHPDDLGAPVDLNRVAAVYRAARSSIDRWRRRAPVAAVARDLGVHRTDAAWYVREARAVGVLEPAPVPELSLTSPRASPHARKLPGGPSSTCTFIVLTSEVRLTSPPRPPGRNPRRRRSTTCWRTP